LFPHRSDPRKGLKEAVDIVGKLCQSLGSLGKSVRLLVPKGTEYALNVEEGHIYGRIYDVALKRAAELGIGEQIILHDWIPYALLPEYYSLGTATLSIGSFVECFGSNSSIESEACGTPCVISRVAAQRYTFPEAMVYKVDPGDAEHTFEFLRGIVAGERRAPLEDIRSFIKQEYDFKTMCTKYEEALIGTRRLPRLTFTPRSELTLDSRVRLASWCYVAGDRIYHDYEYRYVNDKPLAELLRDGKSISVGHILASLRDRPEMTYSNELHRFCPGESAPCRPVGPDSRKFSQLLWNRLGAYLKHGILVPDL
ncbi:MAG: hypothetical protein AAB393_09645, partial [Bacteroidota bacterium]